MLELLKLKATNGWFDTSFSALLELLTKVLPKCDTPSVTVAATVLNSNSLCISEA
jgi:hypothetical protein